MPAPKEAVPLTGAWPLRSSPIIPFAKRQSCPKLLTAPKKRQGKGTTSSRVAKLSRREPDVDPLPEPNSPCHPERSMTPTKWTSRAVEGSHTSRHRQGTSKEFQHRPCGKDSPVRRLRLRFVILKKRSRARSERLPTKDLCIFSQASFVRKPRLKPALQRHDDD